MRRRNFLIGCSSAVAALATARISSLSFADPGSANAGEGTLVVIYLRGGWDALSVLPPLAGDDRRHYEAQRPWLRIPAQGEGAALPLNEAFGLHPALNDLMALYHDERLAIVQATGMPLDTRSHFDAMRFMETGTPGQHNTPTGWLTRHLQNQPDAGNNRLRAVSVDTATTTSLLGSTEAVAMRDPADFLLVDDAGHRGKLTRVLAGLYEGDSWLHNAGQRTVATIRNLEQFDLGNAPSTTPYPEGEFGERLKTVAALLRRGLNLRVATVDFGGWDTHKWQGEGSTGYLADLLRQLGTGLATFYHDLENHPLTGRLSVVVMSEFGRRLAENASRGTDHGHGSAMFVLGGQVNGGRLYGQWPGLAPEQLYDRADLAVTTDYRQVVCEVLHSLTWNPQLDVVFPGFVPARPMGLMRT